MCEGRRGRGGGGRTKTQNKLLLKDDHKRLEIKQCKSLRWQTVKEQQFADVIALAVNVIIIWVLDSEETKVFGCYRTSWKCNWFGRNKRFWL